MTNTGYQRELIQGFADGMLTAAHRERRPADARTAADVAAGHRGTRLRGGPGDGERLADALLPAALEHLAGGR